MLRDSITVYLDPVCRCAFPLHVIAVMSTRVFSNPIMKCHQQEQAEGKKINYVIIHLTSAIIHAPCVFSMCLCQTHELHPLLIKADCSFYIITDSDVRLQHILFLSVFAAPVIWLQAHLPFCHSLPFHSFPL